MFLELTPTYGDYKLYVSPMCIAMMKQERDGLRIWLTGNDQIIVQESLDEVLTRIKSKKKFF